MKIEKNIKKFLSQNPDFQCRGKLLIKATKKGELITLKHQIDILTWKENFFVSYFGKGAFKEISKEFYEKFLKSESIESIDFQLEKEIKKKILMRKEDRTTRMRIGGCI